MIILVYLGIIFIFLFFYFFIFRICVVPISSRRVKAFVDIICPLSPCPKSKYLVGTNCGKKLSKLGGTGILEKSDKVLLQAFANINKKIKYSK